MQKKRSGSHTRPAVYTPEQRIARRVAQATRAIAAGRNVEANTARIARLVPPAVEGVAQ